MISNCFRRCSPSYARLATRYCTVFWTNRPIQQCRQLGVLTAAFVFFTLTSIATYSHAQSTNKKFALSDFPAPIENFQAHREQVREYILATQMPHREASDAEYNLPFDIEANQEVPYRGKYLLIHGLNDSPFLWKDVARELATRGFDVRAILLPGHGNTPRAQLNISYRSWLKASREHMALYREPGKNFYLGGFSLGGVIATLLAAEKTNEIDGLLLFSPAYKSIIHNSLRWAGIYSRWEPWAFGGMIIEDNPVKYNSIPINTGSQYYKTTQALKRRWPRKRLNIPVLVVASNNDSVINIQHMEDSYKRGFIANKYMIVYDNERAGQTDAGEGIEYRNSSYPPGRVLNQSHQSLLIAPQNPIYGKNGRILVCNGNEYPIFRACLNYQGDHWYGAQHTPSPDGVPVARTTYNPDFDYVMQQFDRLFMP